MHNDYYSSGISNAPFGNPDGSRADLTDVLDKFVDFVGEGAWSGLATKNNDLSARIIVGRKGSGKTVYLRRLQAAATDEESLYADTIQPGPPTTTEIVRFCQWFPKHTLTEQWMLLWNRAILRSLVSHLLHADELKQHIDKTDLNKFESYYKTILRQVEEVVSIYSQVSEVINGHNSARQVENYLRDPRWSELESLIGRVIRKCPPVCFYVDAVDEEFSTAPMFWLRCQTGLFYQTMRFLRDPKFGGRVHIFICVRDLVIAAIHQGEHLTRYCRESHIKTLKWNKNAILFFLRRKVEMLPPELFLNIAQEKSVENWLGFDSIYNEVYKTHEPIEQYIIRHTRLLPRDIVIIGNLIFEKSQENAIDGKQSLSQQDIRDTVSKAARYFGSEQLRICANQLASNAMPARASQQAFEEFYTGNDEYTGTKEEDLKAVVRVLGKDRFTRSELEGAESQSDELLGEGSNPFTILWQNGLLGYLTKPHGAEEHYTFYSESETDFMLPNHEAKYVFHPCLVDTLGLRPMGDKPINPCG